MLVFFFLALVAADIPDVWQRLASMQTARSDTVAVQSSGFIYIGGGCIANQSVTGSPCPAITNSFERYDIKNNVWNYLDNLPVARFRHSCAQVNGKIYFIHGRDINDNVITQVDVYDIATQKFTQLTGQDTSLLNVSDSAAFVIGTTIYVTGGWKADYSGTVSSTITLNVADSSPKFKSGTVPNKAISQGDLGAISLNGKGYAFGGFNETSNFPLNTFEEYDPATNKWTILPGFIHSRGDMGSAVVGNLLFVIGGEDKNTSNNNQSYPVADVEQWDSTTRTWSERTPISESRFRFTSTQYDRTIYNLGGQENAVKNASGGTDYFPIDNHVASLLISSAASTSFASSITVLFAMIITLFYQF